MLLQLTYKELSENHLLDWKWSEATLNGWGLDPQLLSNLALYLNQANRIIEFGSGSSTQFMLDYREKHNLDYELYSFDHNVDHAFKPALKHKKFKLKIRELVQYEEGAMSQFLTGGKLGKKIKVPKEHYGNTRLKNCFYNLKKNDLVGKYDIVIVDGPNGNGRGFSYGYLKGHIDVGTIIIIDDFHHHPFLAHCNMVLNTKVVYHKNDRNFHHLHGYAIMEVI